MKTLLSLGRNYCPFELTLSHEIQAHFTTMITYLHKYQDSACAITERSVASRGQDISSGCWSRCPLLGWS